MSAPAHQMVLPLDRLPADPRPRRDVLGDYFGDLLASAEATGDGWAVRLTWPDFAEFFVDPLVPSQLGWWAPGVRLGEMRRAVVGSESAQLSLDDAWTLFAWSRWLGARCGAGGSPAGVVIVHIDDHRDMMTPRVAWDGTQWSDLLTGRRFAVSDPESVRAAVLSGAVGVGSFFAPLLHELPGLVVRHLSQSAAQAEDGREWALVREAVADTVLEPGRTRPGIRRELVGPDPWRAGGGASGRYRFTRNYHWCFSDLPPGPVLLHIDMDYFNNRYDRDSDWRDRPTRLDPCGTDILAKIDELFAALKDFKVIGRVESVAVALSPGFFPAEYWPASVERLQQHLTPLGFDLGFGGGEPAF